MFTEDVDLVAAILAWPRRGLVVGRGHRTGDRALGRRAATSGRSRDTRPRGSKHRRRAAVRTNRPGSRSARRCRARRSRAGRGDSLMKSTRAGMPRCAPRAVEPDAVGARTEYDVGVARERGRRTAVAPHAMYGPERDSGDRDRDQRPAQRGHRSAARLRSCARPSNSCAVIAPIDARNMSQWVSQTSPWARVFLFSARTRPPRVEPRSGEIQAPFASRT